MELTLKQALQQGITTHREGKLRDAERLYRAILQSQPKHPDANHNLGLIAVSVNKVTEALPLFKTAVDANPEVEQFWVSYVDALIKAKKLGNARRVIEQARGRGISDEKLQPLEDQIPAKLSNVSPPKERLNELMECYQNGRYDDARQLAESIAESFPEHVLAWKVLGKVYSLVGKDKESLNAKEKAVQVDPNDAGAHYNLGNALKGLGRLDDAEASFRQALALKSDFAEAHFNLGDTLKKQGRLHDAETSLRQSIEFKSDHAVAHNNLGATLQDLGRLNEADASFRQAIALKPDYFDAHYNLAIILKKLCRLSEAEASMRQAIALKADFSEAHHNLGKTLKELDKLDEAEASFRHAIALEPDNFEAHNNYGATLQALGRSDDAAICYRNLIAIKPDYSEAHNNFGAVLQDMGRFDEAEASYRHALVLKPDFAEAHYNLGNTLRELGRLDEAEASYLNSTELKPDYFEAHNNYGAVLQDLGRFAEAEAIYRHTTALKPNYAEAHRNLGNTLRELGKLDEAEESYRHAISLKPNYTEAHSDLGATLQELGRIDEAGNIYHLMLTKKSEQVSDATVSPVIALLPFGRAGSLFFHSLIDGHPEVATLPGVYFRGWFGADQWSRFAPDYDNAAWREHLVAKIIQEYEPFFNPSCKNNVAGKPFGNSKWLAKDQGFTNMGPDQSRALIIDAESFSDVFLSLLRSFSSIGIQQCFELIHRAFEISARGKTEISSQRNSCIFYHIHNPDPYEHAHFLKHYPQARLLHIIRNPLQSMESWMSCGRPGHMISADCNKSINTGRNQVIVEWNWMVNVAVSMFTRLQSPLNIQAHSRSVRLEDIKINPHVVMPKIADWMGISDHPALYESCFCGFQYWGPASKETGKITGFDTKAIDLPIGRILGNRDILIFETLFWPLSSQCGYTQVEAAEFRHQLMEIRPWIDEPLEFEKRLYGELDDHTGALEKFALYTRLHRLLVQLWDTLYQEGTYRNMIEPLEH